MADNWGMGFTLYIITHKYAHDLKLIILFIIIISSYNSYSIHSCTFFSAESGAITIVMYHWNNDRRYG